jgi:hypothetical protein
MYVFSYIIIKLRIVLSTLFAVEKYIKYIAIKEEFIKIPLKGGENRKTYISVDNKIKKYM